MSDKQKNWEREGLTGLLRFGLAMDSDPARAIEHHGHPFPYDGGTSHEHFRVSGGDQYKFKFANGFGASVVRHSFSYGSDEGLWELAVLGRDGRLTYDTPITDDVVGRLTEGEVADLLVRIEALS